MGIVQALETPGIWSAALSRLTSSSVAMWSGVMRRSRALADSGAQD